MGRIRQHIKVHGKKFWTLFDTGARNTYVVPAVAATLGTFKLPKGITSRLGGSVRKVTKGANLLAEVDGHKMFTDALVIDDIGQDEAGQPIEILFGALAMQRWGIRLIPDEERLDLTYYSDDFVEF